MTAQIIDGKALAQTIAAQCREQARALDRAPGLAVIIVGDNPASAVYVRNKQRACEEAGFYSQKIALPDSISEAELLAKVRALGEDSRIDGILVQLPLPPHISGARVTNAILPHKDVDGFHPQNIGALALGKDEGLAPCTPAGCIRLLESADVAVSGANAVIVGRSNIVGKPLALMMINRGATVTVCNSKTRDLAAVCGGADILVAAVGRAGLITGDMVKPGATVIDVGINRLPDGKKITGDVDFESAAKIAGHITPVPGGVGPMTIAMLLANTLRAAQAARAASAAA
jgi:methylenetetrahydrofolate dehydrogenase (NADP+)/methenyltetrahydrofolate cyclohydrolase